MPSELDELAALLRDHGTPLGLDTGQADEFDCCADMILAAGYRRTPATITDAEVEAAAGARRCSWSIPDEHHPTGDLCRMEGHCLDTARAMLEAAAAVRHG